MSDLSDNYLHDLGQLLLERLAEAERLAATAQEHQKQFEAGRYRAYREVVALMLSQADVFELPTDLLSLARVDREKDLGC